VTIVADNRSIVPIDRIQQRILFLRGERVLTDVDLAELYGVTTKALNQAVKRNRRRFPADFMFRLNKSEKREVVTNCDHLQKLKFSPVLPHVFSEHGAIMLASVLNSQRAVEVSLCVVRAFVQLRRILASHAGLARKLAALERKYDAQFRVVFDAIRQLMEPPPDRPRKRIGYITEAEGRVKQGR
jgi:hypothetical protein